MSLTIAEALQQAQQALDSGDYGSATTTCTQLVNQFSGYASAHRLLGEAYREQGQPELAERALTAALARQPRQPETCLGLGLVAEDQGANEAALAFCQVAWELAPNQLALREPLTRVSLRRYGSDGELQLTHAALAQLHASASRLRRAVSEYRLALAQLPNRVDLQLGLIEALWRLGNDSEALQRARTLVEQQPECAPALVVLTDLEQRSGNSRRASDLRQRLRAVDPDGSTVADMLPLNPRADQQFLTLDPAEMPFLDEEVIAVTPERPKLAPAPDFEYNPIRSEVPTPDITELAPMSFADFGAADGDLPDEVSDVAAFSVGEFSDLPEGLMPISIEELGGLPDEVDDPFDLGMSSLDTPPTNEAPTPFTLEEVLQFESPAPIPASQPEPMNVDDQLFFSESEAAIPTSETAPIDDLASLAAALEGDVADALQRAGEPVDVVIDDVETTRPPSTPPRGYTTMLRGLEDQGLAPFDPRSREPVEGMPSMLADELPTFEAVTPADSSLAAADDDGPQTDEFGKITRDWDTIDDEIQAAMPVTAGHGYTDELRSLDEIGLTPFEVEEDETLAGVTPFNPFASDPGSPVEDPLADLDVTVTDERPSFSASSIDEDTTATDELLGGLEPFAFEEFDSGQGPDDGQSRSFFGQPSWESSASAVPSDADLDALLAFEDDDPLTLPENDLTRALSDEDVHVSTPAAEEDTIVEAIAETPAPPAAIDEDILLTPPPLTDDDLGDFFEASFAVTRQLPDEAMHPVLESDTATSEVETSEFTESVAIEDTDEVVQAKAVADVEAEDVPTKEKGLTSSLLPNTEVFTRARAVKLGLMSEGRISGTRELGEGITTDELMALEDRFKTRNLPENGVDPLDDDDDLLTSTGATRDTRTLRAALEVTPDDDELRWWLAEALRDRGDIDDAYTEYRWLIRHAPHRHDQILNALTDSVEREQLPETAHRLLGDIYRRRGDVTRASNHAALALQVRRRSGRLL